MKQTWARTRTGCCQHRRRRSLSGSSSRWQLSRPIASSASWWPRWHKEVRSPLLTLKFYSDVSRSDDLVRTFREISPRGRKESASRALGLPTILRQPQPTNFLDYQNLLQSPCCGVKKSRSSRAGLTFLSPGNAVILKLSALSFWNRVDERFLHISLIFYIRKGADLGPRGRLIYYKIPENMLKDITQGHQENFSS